MLIRRENGLVINNEILRSQMLVLFSKAGKSHLVTHVGALGRSWAQRFWVRHNFPVRKGTTKMRVPKPQDADNLQTYLDVITEVSERSHQLPFRITDLCNHIQVRLY
jgi:hypothetical protein